MKKQQLTSVLLLSHTQAAPILTNMLPAARTALLAHLGAPFDLASVRLARLDVKQLWVKIFSSAVVDIEHFLFLSYLSFLVFSFALCETLGIGDRER